MKYLTHGLAAGALMSVSLGAVAVPMYSAQLGALNDSGVTGNATLGYDSSANSLDVHVQATGLEAGMPHPMHIHGVIGGDSVSPTSANDSPSNGGDGDGYVELNEAASSYGAILVPLTSPPGGATADFPTAPDGTIDFSQTYDLSSANTYNDGYDESNLLPLSNREIVIHGMSLGAGQGSDGGEADGTAGYKAVLPVASGVITAQGSGQGQAVPEPGNLTMLFFGVTLIGGLSIARKRHSASGDRG